MVMGLYHLNTWQPYCPVFRWIRYSGAHCIHFFSVAPTKDKDVDKKLGRLATEIMSSEGVPAPSTRDGKGLLVFKRIQAHKSGPFDFEGIKFAQELSSPHLGPIWCMRFSHCGQLLATAGQVLALCLYWQSSFWKSTQVTEKSTVYVTPLSLFIELPFHRALWRINTLSNSILKAPIETSSQTKSHNRQNESL